MSREKRVISISGVHGVGKSTLVRRLCDMSGVEYPCSRQVNPFHDPLLSMLFWVLAFSERDRELYGRRGLVFMDRHAARDIIVDAWTMCQLKILGREGLLGIVELSRKILLSFPLPTFGILLDDSVEEILRRLEERKIPAGHDPDLERNIDYVTCLRNNFLTEFEDCSITRGEFGLNLEVPYGVVSVDGREPSELAEEILLEIGDHS